MTLSHLTLPRTAESGAPTFTDPCDARDPASWSRTELGDAAVIEAFHDVAGTVTSQPGIEPVLRVAAGNACDLLAVDRCSIFLRGSNSGIFHGVAARSPGDSDIVRHLRCGVTRDRMSQEIVATRQPVLVRDAVADGRPVRSTMVNLQVREVLGVPLVFRQQVYGLMFLDLVGHHRGFSAIETRLVTFYADLIAGLLPVLHQVDDLHSAVRDLQMRSHESARTRRFADEIACASSAGTTPQQIAASASTATGRGSWFTDGAHRPIAHGGEGGNAARIGRLLNRPATIEALRALPDSGVLDLSTEPDGLLVAPITVDGHRRGNMSLICDGRPMTEHDKTVLRTAAHAISVELRVEAQSAMTTSEGRQQIARAMIEGNLDAVTHRRAALHSIPMDCQRVVCLVAQRRASSIRLDARDLAQAFDSVTAGPPALATPTAEGAIAVLVDLGEDSPSELAQRASTLTAAALKLADAEDTLIAAISSPITAVDQAPRAFDESQRVLHCLRQLCPESTTILSADDLGFAGVLLSAIDRTGADQHVHKTLGRLLSDHARDHEMLHTADVFFDHARNIRDTARALSVHENTVRYRLSRIHQLTGLDLTGNSDHQVSCQLALLILRLRGQLSTTNPLPHYP